MEIIFAFDKEHNKDHFLVNHSNISEEEILEVFANKYAEFEARKKIGIIGHTNNKKFLVVIGVYGKKMEVFRVITAYPACKKHLIYYKQEVSKHG